MGYKGLWQNMDLMTELTKAIDVNQMTKIMEKLKNIWKDLSL